MDGPWVDPIFNYSISTSWNIAISERLSDRNRGYNRHQIASRTKFPRVFPHISTPSVQGAFALERPPSWRDYPGSLTMNRQLATRDERDRDQTRAMFPNSRQSANKSYASSASRNRGATRFQLKWRNLWPCDYFGIAFERRPRIARMRASQQTLSNFVQSRSNAKILRLYKGDLGETLVIPEYNLSLYYQSLLREFWT